jgi:protocatechuate 3,4-dioxygenase, beta subunit
MKYQLFSSIALLLSLASCAQGTNKPEKTSGPHVGGSCEGCEAIYESPVAFEKLSNLVWLPDWKEKGPKLAINGVVYKSDGKTPAPGVIIYVYHTDQKGIYPSKGDETGWAKRHGYLRGWMKTNEKGEYKFFTLRPVPYPGRNFPAHIHVTIKEPGKNEYYIDEYVFDDDPLLTEIERKKVENRGGNGIIKLKEVEKDFFKSERNIYLGKNIPDYH